MAIEVRCSKCSKALTVADRLAGTEGTCPYCSAPVSYPRQKRRTNRIVISVGEETRKIETSSTSRASREALDAGARSAARRGLFKGILALTVAALVVAAMIIYPNLTKNEQIAEARGVLVEMFEETADMGGSEREDFIAWQRYTEIARRARKFLENINPLDLEIKQLLEKSELRAEELKPR